MGKPHADPDTLVLPSDHMLNYASKLSCGRVTCLFIDKNQTSRII